MNTLDHFTKSDRNNSLSSEGGVCLFLKPTFFKASISQANALGYMIGLKVTDALDYELFQGEENGAKVVSSLKGSGWGSVNEREQIYNENTGGGFGNGVSLLWPSHCFVFEYFLFFLRF